MLRGVELSIHPTGYPSVYVASESCYGRTGGKKQKELTDEQKQEIKEET